MKIWLVVGAFVALAAVAPAQTAKPDGESQELLEKTCGGCHPMTLSVSRRGTRADWEHTITKMIGKGLDAPEEDLFRVLDILTKYYGPRDDAKLEINKAPVTDIAKFFDLTGDDADKIVKHRDAEGGIKSWDQLAKAGVDPRKLEPKKDRIVY